MTLWIGLTGGIGSGKSSIAQMFAELGVPIIDADAISRSLTAENGEALSAIRQLFGDEVFDSEGRLNRIALREEVFRRPQSKKQLENLLLPLILNKIQQQKQKLASSAYGIVDVPLLIENPAFKAETDRILVVDVPESVQIKRVHQRNGFQKNKRVKSWQPKLLALTDCFMPTMYWTIPIAWKKQKSRLPVCINTINPLHNH